MNENLKNTKEILEEKLDELQDRTEAPGDLKEAVFNTLDTMSLFADLADLFTVKFTETSAVAINTITDELESTKQEMGEEPN